MLPNMSALQGSEWELCGAKPVGPGKVGPGCSGSFFVKVGSRFGWSRKYSGHKDSDRDCGEWLRPEGGGTSWLHLQQRSEDPHLAPLRPIRSAPGLWVLSCFQFSLTHSVWVVEVRALSHRLQKRYSDHFKRTITPTGGRERDWFYWHL